MEILETFEFAGKLYEIGMIDEGGSLSVRAYHQNKEANRFIYSIKKEIDKDFIRVHGRSSIKELVQQAKQDIIGS